MAGVPLEQRIAAAEARAMAACCAHDQAAEWAAECTLQLLYAERADTDGGPENMPNNIPAPR